MKLIHSPTPFNTGLTYLYWFDHVACKTTLSVIECFNKKKLTLIVFLALFRILLWTEARLISLKKNDRKRKEQYLHRLLLLNLLHHTTLQTRERHEQLLVWTLCTYMLYTLLTTSPQYHVVHWYSLILWQVVCRNKIGCWFFVCLIVA